MVNNTMFIAQLSDTHENSITTSSKSKYTFFYHREDLIEYKTYIKKANHFFKKGELMEAYHHLSLIHI